jgi:glycosyltransferase involved in cell wall biosynthesis
MRIAFVNPSVELGGAESVLLHLLWSLRASTPEHELHLLLPADGPLGERAAILGAIPHIVPMPDALARAGESHLRRGRIGDWLTLVRQSAAALSAGGRFVRGLRRGLDRVRPAIIHSNGIKTHLALAAARPKAAVVWHVHDFLSARPLTSRLLRLTARRVCGVVAVSEAVARDTRNLLPGRPVVAIPNAIDLNDFTPGGAISELDRLAGLPAVNGAVRVGLVATYAPWKGHDVFLAAAGRLAARRPDLRARFYVIGGPIYQTRAQWSEPELQELANRAGLSGQVGFVPFQEHPAGVYRGLDIVVHASTRPEPFGLTIVEGMACGRAVIVSRAGGAAELFTNGFDAIGVYPGDAEALAAAIERLADDAEMRRRLGEHARSTAVERYDRRRLGPAILRAYEGFGNQANL